MNGVCESIVAEQPVLANCQNDDQDVAEAEEDSSADKDYLECKAIVYRINEKLKYWKQQRLIQRASYSAKPELVKRTTCSSNGRNTPSSDGEPHNRPNSSTSNISAKDEQLSEASASKVSRKNKRCQMTTLPPPSQDAQVQTDPPETRSKTTSTKRAWNVNGAAIVFPYALTPQKKTKLTEEAQQDNNAMQISSTKDVSEGRTTPTLLKPPAIKAKAKKTFPSVFANPDKAVVTTGSNSSSSAPTVTVASTTTGSDAVKVAEPTTKASVTTSATSQQASKKFVLAPGQIEHLKSKAAATNVSSTAASATASIPTLLSVGETAKNAVPERIISSKRNDSSRSSLNERRKSNDSQAIATWNQDNSILGAFPRQRVSPWVALPESDKRHSRFDRDQSGNIMDSSNLAGYALPFLMQAINSAGQFLPTAPPNMTFININQTNSNEQFAFPPPTFPRDVVVHRAEVIVFKGFELHTTSQDISDVCKQVYELDSATPGTFAVALSARLHLEAFSMRYKLFVDLEASSSNGLICCNRKRRTIDLKVSGQNGSYRVLIIDLDGCNDHRFHVVSPETADRLPEICRSYLVNGLTTTDIILNVKNELRSNHSCLHYVAVCGSRQHLCQGDDSTGVIRVTNADQSPFMLLLYHSNYQSSLLRSL